MLIDNVSTALFQSFSPSQLIASEIFRDALLFNLLSTALIKQIKDKRRAGFFGILIDFANAEGILQRHPNQALLGVGDKKRHFDQVVVDEKRARRLIGFKFNQSHCLAIDIDVKPRPLPGAFGIKLLFFAPWIQVISATLACLKTS